MIAPPLRILIVDDNEHDALLMSRAIGRDGTEHQFKRVETPEELERALRFETWDVVLSDHAMPRMDSLHVLRRTREIAPQVPVIVVSGFIGEEAAAHVVREGARDFVSKERLGFLAPTITRAIGDERRRQELEQARTQLARNERLAAIGTFAHGAAHEINNPLTIIQMEAEMAADQLQGALRRASLAEEERAVLASVADAQQAILRNASRIAAIVQAIGTLSSVARPTGEPLNVDDTVRQAIPEPPERVKLVTQLHAEASAEWPRSSIHHIVSTLVENAYDAVLARPEGIVTVVASSDGTRATIEVHDNGTGIPAEVQPLLFTPFHSTKPSGTGLNLAIAHRLVQDLGGTLTFTTEPNVGTRFQLRLPLVLPVAAGPREPIVLRLP